MLKRYKISRYFLRNFLEETKLFIILVGQDTGYNLIFFNVIADKFIH